MAHYDVRSVPNVLLGHTIAKEYQITGMTPMDFLSIHTHSGLEFNMEELKMEFRKHCDDYMEELDRNKPSKAVEFCYKVIFEFGPESRKANRGTRDKIWKCIFSKAQDKHIVFVVTYKHKNAQFTSKNDANYMVLTVEEAGLLVQETFSQLIKLCYSTGCKLMNPLASACFSKDDTSSLAEELGITEVELLVNLSQSTQSGGQYLTQSDIDIAVCFSIAVTRNVKDKNLRKRVVIKVLKQYINKGFALDKNRFAIISKYVTGGVPLEFAYEELLRDSDSKQKKCSPLAIAKAMKQSEIYVRVQVPESSK